MIIAGPCSYITNSDTSDIIKCAKELEYFADVFRVKIILGGTIPEKFVKGIGFAGIEILELINSTIMPVITEIHVPYQMEWCNNLYGLWIGARNSSNYTLLEEFAKFKGEKFIKRHPGMTIKEIMGIYTICDLVYKYQPYIIERGTNYLSRRDKVRWSISLNDILEIKYTRPDIFEKLIVDCSHSAGLKRNVGEIYNATKALGVEHFMFEASIDGKSKTDQNQMLSVKELKEIIK